MPELGPQLDAMHKAFWYLKASMDDTADILFLFRDIHHMLVMDTNRSNQKITDQQEVNKHNEKKQYSIFETSVNFMNENF